MESELRALLRELRELKREMRSKGIRRISCFNGGHSSESYRANARCFELETKIQHFGDKRAEE